MRILVTGDWHGDWYTAGVRRFEDIQNAANATVKAANERDVDHYLFLGDLTDPEPDAFWASQLAIRVANSLKCSSTWLVGNHDIVEDGYGTHTLLPLSVVKVGAVEVVAEPSLKILRHKGAVLGGVALLMFPYTSTARTYDPVVVAETMAAKVPEGYSVLIASHLMLEGIGPGSETMDMPRGRDVFLPVEFLQKRLPGCVITNGHYHQAQTFNGVHIPGSLVRLTQNEIGNVPGYLIVDVP